jgi:uncharacterized lipoprotein YmbA
VLRSPLVALLAGVLLASCASPSQQFYTLRLAAEPQAAPTAEPSRRGSEPVPAAPGAALRVLSVSVAAPDALDRSQWVLRRGEREVQVLDQVRWPQPLTLELADALAQRLDRRMPSGWAAIAATERLPAVQVRVLSFDAWWSPARVSDEFAWEIACRTKDGTRLTLAAGRSRYVTAAAQAAGAETLTAEHARALDQLAADIADAWRSRAQPEAPC